MYFPRMPVLEAVAAQTRDAQPLKGVALVGVQHLLETPGSLMEALYSAGLRPEDTFLLGKSYSSSASVEARFQAGGATVVPWTRHWRPGFYEDRLAADVDRLWSVYLASDAAKACRAVVVLDDGGLAVVRAPGSAPVVGGVEQTTSGIERARRRGGLAFPVVEVASCAAKTLIERPMIRDAVFGKLASGAAHVFSGAKRYGVVGLGNIGSAVAEGLVARFPGRVTGYDKDPARTGRVRGVTRCDVMAELFDRADVIFGCTGVDILAGAGEFWRDVRGEKVLVSCSSQDKEFASALRMLPHADGEPMGDLIVRLRHGSLRLVHGGFPANFDGSPESAPGRDIQMTRGLLLGGVLQAVLGQRDAAPHGYRLSPSLQRLVVGSWLQAESHRREWYPRSLIEMFEDIEGIAQHSGGWPMATDPLADFLAERPVWS